MKRIIKFRVWDTELNQWIWNIGMKTNNVLTNGKERGRFLVMQYTGMTDINKREIFEGDIIEIETDVVESNGWEEEQYMIPYKFRGVVHFRPSTGYGLINCTSSREGEDFVKRRPLQRIVQSKSTIIGNIHENPEKITQ